MPNVRRVRLASDAHVADPTTQDDRLAPETKRRPGDQKELAGKAHHLMECQSVEPDLGVLAEVKNRDTVGVVEEFISGRFVVPADC